MSQSRRFTAVLLLVGMTALPIMAIAPALADSKDESADDSERASNAEPSDGVIESGTVAPPPGEFTPGLPTYLEHYSRPFVIDHDEVHYTRRYYFHRLLHPEPSDKRWGVGVLAASFAMATRKWQIQREVAEDDSPSRRQFFREAQKLGGPIAPGIAVLFYVTGSAFQDYRTKETGVMLAESMLLSGMVTVVGQWALSEERPREGGELHPFEGRGHGVSGHTSTAAAVASVLSRQYLQVSPEDGRVARAFKRIGKGFVYAAPAAVAFGRVNEQQHFAYSTVLGLGIGLWTGHVVADAHGLYLEKPRAALRPTSVGPIVGDHGEAGIGARWNF